MADGNMSVEKGLAQRLRHDLGITEVTHDVTLCCGEQERRRLHFRPARRAKEI